MKIKKLLLGALFASAATLSLSAADAKYIFYFIGDGMGMGPVMTAQSYNRVILKNDKPLLMMQFPTVSWCQTYSASSLITDSAAAGTALSTGTKTRNSMLGMAPDTTVVTSIARIFKDTGYGVGVVTSVAPDDATPGAFYAHVPNRGMYYEIGKQAASSGYDFIAGAGLRGRKDKEGKATDLMDVMAQNNVQVVYGRDGVKEINSDKVMLLNTDGPHDWDIHYAIDSLAENLTLPIITEACLNQLLNNSPDKFFMMVEGGLIDHALHGNDGGAAIIETLNFDESLKIAYDFYLAHPDETLIVVTADHDTGGLALGNNRTPHLEYFKYQRVSKEAFNEYCKSLARNRMVYRWEDMREYLRENFGFFDHVPVGEKEEARLKELFEAAVVLRNSDDQKTLYANFNSFSVEVFRVLNNAAGIGFTTTSHSGNPVPVFAVGAGSDKFMHLNNNNNLPRLILEAAGK